MSAWREGVEATVRRPKVIGLGSASKKSSGRSAHIPPYGEQEDPTTFSNIVVDEGRENVDTIRNMRDQ
jgi:hypothetical protein